MKVLGRRKERKPAADDDSSVCESESARGGEEDESTALSINEEMQKMLNQLYVMYFPSIITQGIIMKDQN